jgi:hypothetical protein
MFFSRPNRSPVGQGPLIFEALPSHSDTPHSVRLLWAGDQPDLTKHNTDKWQNTAIHTRGGIRTVNPVSKRPQTYALDRAEIVSAP